MVDLKSMPKWRVFMMLLAIFLSTFTAMGDQLITPIANMLWDILDGATDATVNWGMTGCTLLALPFILVAGWLCDHFDKKILLVVGFGLYAIGTVFGAVYLNVIFWDVMRSVAMVGWGLQNVSALAILAAVFTEEDEHGKVVGWYNGVMSILGALLAFAGGQLAMMFVGNELQGVYRGYLATIPILILIILFVPSIKPVKHDHEAVSEDSAAATSSGMRWWVVLVPLIIQVFLVTLAQTVNLMMLSLYVSDAGVGDAAFTGTLMSVDILVSAAGSFVFGPLYARLKRWITVPAIGIMAVAFLIMGLFPSAPSAVIGNVLLCFGWSQFLGFFYSYCVDLVPAIHAGKATSFVNFSYSLAAAISTYGLTALMGIANVNAVGAWGIYGGLLAVITVASVLGYALHRQKKEGVDA